MSRSPSIFPGSSSLSQSGEARTPPGRRRRQDHLQWQAPCIGGEAHFWEHPEEALGPMQQGTEPLRQNGPDLRSGTSFGFHELNVATDECPWPDSKLLPPGEKHLWLINACGPPLTRRRLYAQPCGNSPPDFSSNYWRVVSRYPPWLVQTLIAMRDSSQAPVKSVGRFGLGVNLPFGLQASKCHPCSRGDPPGRSCPSALAQGPPGTSFFGRMGFRNARGDPPLLGLRPSGQTYGCKSGPLFLTGYSSHKDPPLYCGTTGPPGTSFFGRMGFRNARGDPPLLGLRPFGHTYGRKSGPLFLTGYSSHKDPPFFRQATGPPGAISTGMIDCWPSPWNGRPARISWVGRCSRGDPPGKAASRRGCDPPRSVAGPAPPGPVRPVPIGRAPPGRRFHRRRGPPGSFHSPSSLSAGRCRERIPDVRPETRRHDVARKPKPKSRKITPWL